MLVEAINLSRFLLSRATNQDLEDNSKAIIIKSLLSKLT